MIEMNGKYIYYVRIDEEKPTGIQKKILAQLKVLNRGGSQCEMYYLESECDSKYRFFLQNIPGIGHKYSKWIYDESLSSLDYLYIRRPSVFDTAFLKYLGKIKNNNPKIKIVCELPTYPYDAEYTGKAGKFTLMVDKRNRKKMQGLIDAFAIVAWNSIEDMLWGIPVLPIFNGIDLNKIKKIVKRERDNTQINLLCIAYFSPWHGYEKFIEALASYYRSKAQHKQDVYLHMVGTGPELDKYKEIVKRNAIEDKVIFYGEVNEGVDEIYQKCDIGVCSINSRHFGVLLSSQLKSREYLAKGLPIITCGDIDVLQAHDFPYELIVDYDRKIDFGRVVEFYNNKVLPDPKKATDEIRKFAENTCDWSSTMASVLDFIGV